MGKGEATRAAILRLRRCNVASVQGLESLSIGRLAELSGLSKSGLFAHFGSKEALQKAVLESVVEDFRSRVILPALREPGGVDRMRRLFALWPRWATEERGATAAARCSAASTELDDRPGELRDYLVEKAGHGSIASPASRRKRSGRREFRARSRRRPVRVRIQQHRPRLQLR